MKQAKQLNEIINVSETKPLTGEDFDNFFVNTDEARGCQPAIMLADFLHNSRTTPGGILFTGHRGSGKSTELWRFQQQVKEDYFPVVFSVAKHLDLLNIEYTDLVFLIMEQVFKAARENNIKIDDDLLHNILKWVEDTTEIKTSDKNSGVEVEAGAAPPKLLSALFLRITGILKYSSEIKKEIRLKIKPRINQLIERCNHLLGIMNRHLLEKGKRSLVIVEDLDKINISSAREIFCENPQTLAQLDTHIIYTVPIFILYSREMALLRGNFARTEVLPMIKVKEKNSGKIFQPGFSAVKEILYKRIDPSILREDAIRFMFKKSGGSLNDIFAMLQDGALAGLRQQDIFDLELAKTGCNRIKRFYEMAISGSPELDIQPEQYLKKLKQIYRSKTKKISADKITMDLLYSLALLEYNEERWVDVHPIVVDVMKEMGELSQRLGKKNSLEVKE
jgi:Cdc6-like AAA superfamily ATPase